jgi:cbb3-type cytochrome oxidase maturation protein
MEVIFLLIGVSLSLAVFFLIAFLWAVKSGQFDDCETPSHKILWDDGKSVTKKNEKKGREV